MKVCQEPDCPRNGVPFEAQRKNARFCPECRVEEAVWLGGSSKDRQESVGAARRRVSDGTGREPVMVIPGKATIADKYGPAMEITEQTAADAYFELLVAHNMSFGNSREKAEEIERANLGYYAGYYNHETRLRVERLFRCEHPVFGAAKDGVPTTEQAFAMGLAAGKALRSKRVVDDEP